MSSDGITGFTLPVNVPSSSHEGLIMVYYTPGGEDSTRATIAGSGTSTLSRYNGHESGNTLSLLHGINIIKIPYGCTSVTFAMGSVKCSLVIGDITLTKSSVTNDNNLNIKALGISASDTSDFLDIISSLTSVGDDTYTSSDVEYSQDLFYYNAPLDNNLLIDTDSMEDEDYHFKFWYDYNNVYNKFVISQLDDSSFVNIQLAKASKL